MDGNLLAPTESVAPRIVNDVSVQSVPLATPISAPAAPIGFATALPMQPTQPLPPPPPIMPTPEVATPKARVGLPGKAGLVIGFAAFALMIFGATTLFNLGQTPGTGDGNRGIVVPEQDLGEEVSLPETPTIIGEAQTLIINGDMRLQGSLDFGSGSFSGTVVQGNLTANQTYTLPDETGVFCLDSNNCAYVTGDQITNLEGQVTDLQGSIEGFDEAIAAAIAGSGVASLAGTANEITVSGSIGDIIIGLPDDVTIASTLDADELATAGTVRITSTGVLQNVTHANAGSFFTGGTLPVSRGGTGMFTFNQYGVIYGNTTGALGVTVAGITGECFVGNTGGAPSWTDCDVAAGGATPGGLAGGDLGGSYPNPTVNKLQGTDLLINVVQAGHMLVYNATNSRWDNVSLTTGLTVSETGVVNITDPDICYTSANCTVGSGIGGGSSVLQGGNAFGVALTIGTNDNFALNFETNGSTAMTILANGNVGIGTTNPGAKLEINNGELLITDGTTGLATIQGNSTGELRIGREGAQQLRLYSNGGSADHRILDTDGNAYMYLSGSSGGGAVAGRVGFISTPDSDTSVTIHAQSASNKALVVRGASSQSDNLQEWQNSAGTVLLSVSAAGEINMPDVNQKLNGPFGSYIQLYGSGGNIQLVPQGSAYVNVATALTTPQALISSSGSPLSNVNLSVVANGPTYQPIVARGAASQTANLQEWQNSSGTALASITPAGRLAFGSSGDTYIYRVGTNDMRVSGWFATDVNAITASVTNVSQSVAIGPVTGLSLPGIGFRGGEINLYRSATDVLTLTGTTNTQLAVKAMSGQTADLQQWQNSGGAILTAVQSDGKLVFGPSGSQDTNLYRVTADVLGTDSQFLSITSSAGGAALSATVSGDSASRFLVTGDGTIEWGPGNAARDVNLYRSAADRLKTDDALHVAGVLRGLGTVSESAVGSDRIDMGIRAGAPAIVLEDSGSAIWTIDNNAGTFRLFTPGAEKLKVTSGGQLQLPDSGSSAGIVIGNDTSLYRSAANILRTDSSLVLSGNSSVGIGTTSPSAKLDVRDGSFYMTDTDVAHGMTVVAPTNTYGAMTIADGNAGGLSINGYSDNGTSAGGLYLNGTIGHNDPTDTLPAVIINGTKKDGGGTSITALGSSETVFQLQNNSSALLTALGSGNIGIGVTNPSSSALQVQRTLTASGGVTSGTSSTLTLNGASIATQYIQGVAGSLEFAGSHTYSGYYPAGVWGRFSISNSATYNYTTGHFPAGVLASVVTANTSTINVATGVRVEVAVNDTSSIGTYYGVYVAGQTGPGTITTKRAILTEATAGTIQFGAYGAGTLVTDASGNVSASSDARLKNIQGQFNRGLDDLLNIDPILYKWNGLSGMETNNTYAGFSAQNIQVAIPEAVDTDSRGYLTLQDRPILAASVNAIKEVHGATESLDSRITALEAAVGVNPDFTSLNVTGHTTLNSLTVSGNVTVGGKLTVAAAEITGNLKLAGHFITAGDTPEAEVLGATTGMTVEGNDTAGTITFISGDDATELGKLLEIHFAQAFTTGKKPRIQLTPGNSAAAQSEVYIDTASTTHEQFELWTPTDLPDGQTFIFNYFVVE